MMELGMRLRIAKIRTDSAGSSASGQRLHSDQGRSIEVYDRYDIDDDRSNQLQYDRYDVH